jgi:hypothetical protein
MPTLPKDYPKDLRQRMAFYAASEGRKAQAEMNDPRKRVLRLAKLKAQAKRIYAESNGKWGSP